jgi:hypothetical protein
MNATRCFYNQVFLILFPSTARDVEEECFPASAIDEVGMLLQPVDENEYHNSPIWMKLKVSLEVYHVVFR